MLVHVLLKPSPKLFRTFSLTILKDVVDYFFYHLRIISDVVIVHCNPLNNSIKNGWIIIVICRQAVYKTINVGKQNIIGNVCITRDV